MPAWLVPAPVMVNPWIVTLSLFRILNTSKLELFATIIVLAGSSEDLINRSNFWKISTFSEYVPGSTIIVSPVFALFTADCIDCPEWTTISVAAPTQENSVIMRVASIKILILFIWIPPFNRRNFSEILPTIS